MEIYQNLEPGLKNQVEDVLDSLRWRKECFDENTEDSKIYLILDFLNHKEYDVLFGYHAS